LSHELSGAALDLLPGSQGLLVDRTLYCLLHNLLNSSIKCPVYDQINKGWLPRPVSALPQCPACQYDDIQAACAAFPTPVVDWLDDPDFMAMVFAQEAQSSLAHTLYKIKARKARFLHLTNGPSVT
jgi:hypothetical protein